jgi:hypothetical protein
MAIYSASQEVYVGYSQASNCPMVKRFCGCKTGSSGTTVLISSCDSEIHPSGVSDTNIYITSAVTFNNDAISGNTRLNKKSSSGGANSLYTNIDDQDDVVLTYYNEHSNYTYLQIMPLMYMHESSFSGEPWFANAIYNYLSDNPGYTVQEHTVVIASLYTTQPTFTRCRMSASLSDASATGDVASQPGVITDSTQVVIQNTISFSNADDYGGWNVPSWQHGTYTYPSMNEMSDECADAFDKAIYSGGQDVYNPYNCIMPAYSAMESGVGTYRLNYNGGVSEIYVAIKTCIWYTGGSSGLDDISGVSAAHSDTCFGAIEVWGPFYRMYVPSSISISADSKLKLNTSYDSSLSFPNIPGETVVYNSPVTINYTITTPSTLPGYAYLYDDCTLSSAVGTATWNYASGQTTGNSITDNLEITLKSARTAYSLSSSVTGTLTSTNDPYRYSSAVQGHYNSTFTITSYNAYAIYIYDAANCTDDGTSVSINGNPIAVLHDNAGIKAQTCDGILTGVNGTSKSYYIREVLEEQTSSGDIRIVSYNSAGGNPISVVSTSRMVSTPTISSRTLTSDNGSTPLTVSSSSTAISMSNIASTPTARIWKLTFTPSSISDSNDGIINLTTSAYASSGNNIVLSIGYSEAQVASIDASLIKAEDPNDPDASIHIQNSTMYIPWNASEYGSSTLLWISTTYTSSVSGQTPTNLLYDVEIDNLNSIHFQADPGSSTINGGQLGEVSVPLCIVGPGKTTVSIIPEESVGDVSINFDLYVYTTVASIDVTGGLIYDTDGITQLPSTNDTAIGINDVVTLWSVPDEYHTTDITISDARKCWRRSGYRINYIFKDDEGKVVTDAEDTSIGSLAIKYSRNGFGGSTITAGQSLYFGATDTSEDITWSNIVTQSSARLFNGAPNLVPYNGIKTIYFFPGDASNNNYPYPEGTSYLEPTVTTILTTAFGNSTVSKPVKFKVRRTSTEITAITASTGPYYAGTQFRINLTKDGDESWSDLNISVAADGTSGWGINGTSETPTYSVDSNGILSITFPAGMTNQWSHKLIITGTNHYGQEITVYTDDITVYTVNVEDIRVYYNNSVKASSTNSGDLGIIWFDSNDTLSLSAVVYPSDLPDSIKNNISWSVSATSGSSKLIAPSGTTASGQDQYAVFELSGEKTGGVVHTITASVGGVETELDITPKKKSTQIIVGDASVEENSYITIQIEVDGDESVTSSNTTVSSPAFVSDRGSINQVSSTGKCQINAPTNSPNTTDYTFTINFQDSSSGVTLSKTITITVYPDKATYYIYTDFYGGGADKDKTQTIYANVADGESQIAAVDVSAGSRVTKYNVSADSGLLVSTDGQSSWSSSLSNVSITVSRIYIKQDTTKDVVSSTFSRGVRFTAVERDSAGSSDSETKTIKRGRITFSQAVTNPNRPSHSDEMFKEDTATFTVVLTPCLSKPNGYTNTFDDGTWSNSYGLESDVSDSIHDGSAGVFGSTTTITCDATGSNNGAYTGSIRYYYPELSSNSPVITNAYHTFEIDILGQTSVCNALALDPSTQQIMSLAESEASVGYAYTKGSSISTINNVSLASTSTTGYSHNNKLALSYTPTGVTVTSTGIPDDSHDGEIYNISISATNKLGDAITASGNVIWRIGVDGLTFASDAYTKSVYGNTGNSKVYNITCKHNYAGSEVNDDFYFNEACTSINTSGAWWSAVIDNETDTVTVTTTSKNYNTNNRTDSIVLYSKHGLAQFENEPDTCSITFVQNPLIIETTFDITKANGDSTTTITTNPNTITSSFLTAGQTKTFTITCSHIERETSGGQSIGSFEGETVTLKNISDGGFNTPTLSSNILTISAPDNTTGTYPDVGRTCTFNITTSHGASNRTESYAVTATQPGYQYSNSTIIINGNTSDVSDECSSKQQTITYSVACTYDKFVDGYRSATLDGTWTAVKSSSSDTWYTISKSGNTLNIEVEQNPNDDPRTIIIDITGSFDNTTGLENITRTLTIVQSGSRLEFNPARIENISVDGSNGISTDVETNTSWSITDSSSWITNISPTGDSTDPYDASMTFDVEDNYNPNALTDYVKYRSSTSNRNGGISVDTSSGISVHLPVSQQGYTFDASMSYKLNGVSVTSIEIGPDTSTATLEITSNYDYTLSCSVDWVSFGGNQNNKFNDNDGNVFKTNTYVLTFKYNTSDARNTDITISQVRHQANNGEDSVSSKSLTVSQGTAVGHYALSLSENSLRYDAFGTEEVLTKTIDVTSKLGGWTMDADTIQRNNNSENWFHINQTVYTFIDTADTPTQTTTISIRVNPNPDVDNGHSHTITFTHSASGSTAILTITQDQATVYFVYVEAGTNESENDALTRLKELVEFVKDGVDVGIAMAPPPRSIAVTTGGNDAVNKIYYLYYFYGSSPDKNIGYSTTNEAMMSAVYTPKEVPVVVGWEDANSSSSNVYIINVSVNENNTTENRNGIITISGNAAPAVAKIEFTGYQEKRIYQTDLTFAYESGVSYLGDLNGDRWEIPVYGKSYIMKVANKLEYDKLIITNIKINDASVLNPDLAEPIDTSNWATFDYSTSSGVNANWTPFVSGSEITVNENSNLYIRANIANYQLNEAGENRTYENDINVKNYAVQIFVITKSQRDTGILDASAYDFVNGTGTDRLVASQFSKDMYQESWKLLSSEFDVDSNTGSQKVYFRADFNNESINKVLYSEDTGYTLMGSSDTVKNKEIDVLQTILTSSDEQNIAYDVRFGVRLKDN